MSNSRSNAAAINRRAGNIVQQPSYNSRMPQGPPQQSQQSNPKNVRFVPSSTNAQTAPPNNNSSTQAKYFQQPTIPVKTAGVNGPVGQVSISDAFALVTIRLGRVEQFIQQLQEEGVESLGIPAGENQNMNHGSTSVLDIQNTLNENEKTIASLTQKIDAYENTVQNMKDMLLTLTMKNEKNIIETSGIFNKFEENMKTIEMNVDGLIEKHHYLKSQIENQVETNIENQLESTIENQIEILNNSIEDKYETDTEE